MRLVRVHQWGAPEVLKLEEGRIPDPGPDELRIKVQAAGINYVDIYKRRGIYAIELPAVLGEEGAGVVDAVGGSVEGFSPGDQVAFVLHTGSYAEYAIVPASKAVHIPDGLSVQTAAAVMLQGLTAHFLTRSAFSLQEGQIALVHAAAGGVGTLLVQAAKNAGAVVFGTASTEEKARLVKDLGADEVILYSRVDFLDEVIGLTGGEGVQVVYDSVGQTTFEKSLRCLAPRGCMVLYGQASGPAPPLDPQRLGSLGSLYLTRPSLGHYVATREEYESRTRDLFGWILAGKLEVRIDRTFPLTEAPEAHQYMEDRKTKGKILLVP